MNKNSLREQVEALKAQWRMDIQGASRSSEFLRGYWEGMATAHNDLDAILAQYPKEPGLREATDRIEQGEKKEEHVIYEGDIFNIGK